MSAPLLEASGLAREYSLPRDALFRRRDVTRALAPTDLIVRDGEALGIVGESGSGKSTLVRLLLGLDTPSAGRVLFRGHEVTGVRGRRLNWLRRETGVVFQDPYASLDPRMTVGRIVAEPLVGLRIGGDHAGLVADVLVKVGLDPDMTTRYPHEFSGGQRQRIALARAIVHGPRLLVGDEPLSALDVTVRAQILELLRGLRDTLGLTLVIVSHDIGVVHDLCTSIAVMKDGEIVERGATTEVLSHPAHDYTRRLLAAVPSLD